MLLDDFLNEYVPRTSLIESFWKWIESNEHGRLHLSGPSGSGKSWLLRALASELQEREALVVFVEKHPDESLRELIWKAVDTVETLELDADLVRVEVARSLYRAGPTEALSSLFLSISQESESPLFLILDGVDAGIDLALLPAEDEIPRGAYLISAGLGQADSANLQLEPMGSASRQDLLAYLHRRLESQQAMAERVELYSEGNWRYAFHYCQAILSGLFAEVDDLPVRDDLFSVYLERLSEKLGRERFRTVHMDILILLAVAQVPVTADLLHNWGVERQPLLFALFELRHLLRVDGESSSLETLFTGEQYSLASQELSLYLRTGPAWRDRVGEAHRRVVARALKLRDAAWTQSQGQDDEFYALCFASHHLRESGRSADLKTLEGDLYPELCWRFSRLAREQGYDEIAQALVLLAVERFRSGQNASDTERTLRLCEMQTDCCSVLTHQGQYADAARWGEEGLDYLRALIARGRIRDYQPILGHVLLTVAEPFLFMGLLDQAQALFKEALELTATATRSQDLQRTVNALRGLFRTHRARGQLDSAMASSSRALELARKLSSDEGEEWGHYLFEMLSEQIDFLRTLEEDQTSERTALEALPLRLDVLRCCREAAALYERFGWPEDGELAGLLLEESMMLFEMEKWAEAELRLARAIAIYRGQEDVHPGEVASLEYLRSQALALMNRIGEASGSLSRATTRELVEHLDLAERALVLFFRAKVLAHLGNLRESEEVLAEAISAYQQAIGVAGQDELRIELAGALTYRARVQARRGRLSSALKLCDEAIELLDSLGEEPDGYPCLEYADVHELGAWILCQLRRPEEALVRSDASLAWLNKVVLSQVDPDLETERSVSLVTRAQVLAALGSYDEAVTACERAIAIESRRAQEGYDSGPMWVALHEGARATVLRQAGQLQTALEATRNSLSRLDRLASSQQAHLGPQRAAVLVEQARCLEGLEEACGPTYEQALRLYESEILQEKEYLLGAWVEALMGWLSVLRAQGPEAFAAGCQGVVLSLPTLTSLLALEADSEILARARAELLEWSAALSENLREIWVESLGKAFQ